MLDRIVQIIVKWFAAPALVVWAVIAYNYDGQCQGKQFESICGTPPCPLAYDDSALRACSFSEYFDFHAITVLVALGVLLGVRLLLFFVSHWARRADDTK